MRIAAIACCCLGAALPAQREDRRHDGAAFLPLAPGAAWTYRVFENDRELPARMRIEAAERIDTRQGACFELLVTHGMYEQSRLVRVHRGGVDELLGTSKVTLRDDGAPAWAKPLLVCPPGPISEWSSEAPAVELAPPRQPVDRSSRGKVLSFDEVIDVPAGRFHCVLVQNEMWVQDGQWNRVQTWFARGVGIVRERVDMLGRGPVRTIELVHRARAGADVRLLPAGAAAAVACAELAHWPGLALTRVAGADPALRRISARGPVPFTPDSEADWNAYLAESGRGCPPQDRVFAGDVMRAVAAAEAAATLDVPEARLVPQSPALVLRTAATQWLAVEGRFTLLDPAGAELRRFVVELRFEDGAVASLRIRDER